MSNILHKGDLPDDLDLGSVIAVDTETMGLNPFRDRLCVVQISSGDGNAHIVQIAQGQTRAPNLEAILSDNNVLKLFHFARFDIAALQHHFGIITSPVFCTKIASKLVRTYTQSHGLKHLLSELLSIDISKKQQSSDWGSSTLSQDQIDYAASDVLYLHQLHERLAEMLERENRMDIAQSCFDFLPTRAILDLSGWSEQDIFAHS